MKKLILVVSLIHFAFLVIAQENTQPPQNQTLNIEVNGLKNTEATIIFSVFRAEDNFPLGTAFQNYFIEPEGKTSCTLVTDQLPYGEYVIMLFQDLNSDETLNVTKMGLPQEPYAFANNFKPKMTSLPSYEHCKFTFSENNKNLIVKMLD